MEEYIITDGTRFIMKNRSGKYVPTSCESFADVYSKEQAEKIYRNSLSKTLKKAFRIQGQNNPQLSPPSVKQVTIKDLQKTEKVMEADNIQKWLEKISNLNGLASDALHRKQELLTQLKQSNDEMCDVQHFIEFGNFNAAQGYKAYKMLKELRIKRRSIKNELDVLNIILSKRISETVTDEIQRRVAGMDGRQYEPRILKELFNT